jgi:hypothetical protein
VCCSRSDPGSLAGADVHSRHRNRNAQYLVGPSSKDFQALRSRGVSVKAAAGAAYSARGKWFCANHSGLTRAYPPCWLLVRSRCARWTAGEASTKDHPIRRLTSPHDAVTSPCWRSRQNQFQHNCDGTSRFSTRDCLGVAQIPRALFENLPAEQSLARVSSRKAALRNGGLRESSGLPKLSVQKNTNLEGYPERQSDERVETIRIDSVIERVGDLAGFLDGDVALDPPEPVPQGTEGAVPLASGGHRSDSRLELILLEIRGIGQP